MANTNVKGGMVENHIDSMMHGEVVTIIYANVTRFGVVFKYRQFRAYTTDNNGEGLATGLVRPVQNAIAGLEWADLKIIELELAVRTGRLVVEETVERDGDEQ